MTQKDGSVVGGDSLASQSPSDQVLAENAVDAERECATGGDAVLWTPKNRLLSPSILGVIKIARCR